MNIVPLTAENKQDALDVLDSLRKAIEEGDVVAFCCVGIEPDDCTRMWCSSTKKVSRLRMMGAIYNLLHHFTTDE